MKVKVEIRGVIRELDIEQGSTAEDLISKLKLSPDSVIILIDDTPVPYTETLDGKKIKIIRVASGG